MPPIDYEMIQSIQDSTRKVLEKHLVPHIEESEQTGEFVHQAHIELGKLGLAGPMLEENYGGADDLYAQFFFAEEMGYYSNGFGLSSLASTCLFGANVSRHGNEEQKQKYLPLIASGETIGCWGLTEPENGSDAVGIRATAMNHGDHYILNGSKTFITNATISDFFIVIAREIDKDSNPLGQGIQGGTAFILEKDMPGLSSGKPFKKMGHLSSPTGEIFMENLKVSTEAVLGKPGNAFLDMKHSLDVERIIFSGLGTGMMHFCIEKTIQYTKERKQFGRPVCDFQMVQDMIAQMTLHYETSRIYLVEALKKLAEGGDVNKEAAIAKLAVAEACAKVTDLAVQCHGGYGYMQEYEVERRMRDSKLFSIGAGTNEIQKLIIAKQTLKSFSS